MSCPQAIRCVDGLPLCRACGEQVAAGAVPPRHELSYLPDYDDREDFAAEYARHDAEEDL